MNRNAKLSAVALAAILGATLSTTALADRGGPGGHGPMGMDMAPMFSLDEFDANKDGKVTKEEVEAFRADRAAALDADKDGKISAAELQAQIEERMKARAADMAAKMIEMRDTDGDGLLSAAELAEPPMPPMAGMIFDRADADGDGAVTQEEVDALRDRFAERMGERGHGHGPRGGWGWMFGPGGDN